MVKYVIDIGKLFVVSGILFVVIQYYSSLVSDKLHVAPPELKL